jgi:hypothetical protein
MDEIRELDLDLEYLKRSGVLDSSHSMDYLVAMFQRTEDKINEIIKAVNTEKRD